MEKRSWRIARRNGFTAIETVVTVVVLAILAAYATPKLFGLKEQADATEETLKIKDIEERHTQEILKAGKRGSNPTLGDVVGFRPEVVAEPAPDTAPVLIDYSFGFSTSFGTSPSIQTIVVRENSTTSFMDNVEQVTCGTETSALFTPNAYYTANGGAIWTSKLITSTFELVSGSVHSVAPGTPVPKCRGSITGYQGWCNNTPAACGVAAAPHHTWIDGSGNPRTIYSPLTDSTLAYAHGSYNGGLSTIGWLRDLPASKWRLTCASHSSDYGVSYLIKGASGTSNNLEKGVWQAVAWTYLGQIQSSPRYDAADGVPPSVGGAYCERVGPAPAIPPAAPGFLGAYPMAADYSGYCLSQGRKLPTYRDGSGTPTDSSSDPVVELATEAVDDPTNCPG